LAGGVEGPVGPDRSSKEKEILYEGIGRTEREILEKAMKKFKSTRELARYLGVSQPTVVRKLRKHGLSPASMHKRIGLKSN
jgi:TyrR family helix-turn-helix protein